MASPADNAALLVAALDLDLVQLLRGAMRTADIASGKPQAVSELGPAPTPLRDRFDREPVFEQRRVIHPEPKYERRQIIHPQPRIEFPAPLKVESQPAEPPCSCCCVVIKPEIESPLPPPWRQPIWATPIPPTPKVKIVKIRPDIHNKGSLIDFFI